MGFLKNILSGALEEGLSKAVSKAVEKTVVPAAEKFAQKQADAIDKAADKQAKAIEDATSGIDDATAQLDQAAGEVETATKTGMVKDPQTGEMRPMTEEEKAQAKDAAQALKGLGMMFSGAMAQAKKEAAAEEAKKVAAEQAIFEKWEENLPAFPKWDVGGSEFELREEMPRNGKPVFLFSLAGRPYLTELYATKLRSAGFQAMGSNPMDLNADRLYKIIDDVCWVWDRSEGCYDGGITMAFYADQYRPAPKKEAPQASGDLKDLAKGIFKKLF